MGLKQITQILLDQALPRLTPPQDYVLLDALCDDGSGRFARSCYRHLAGFRRSDSRAFGWFSDHHFPVLDALPDALSRRQGTEPGLVFNFEGKIDNHIVNNLESGYHLKKKLTGSKKHADAT